MVDGIGKGSLARSAIEAALESARSRQVDALARLRAAAGQGEGAAATSAPGPSFSDVLARGVEEIEGSVRRAEELPAELARGRLDFHEVAAQLKQSELAFDFAMQVRNKLIDAYREVMRMSV